MKYVFRTDRMNEIQSLLYFPVQIPIFLIQQNNFRILLKGNIFRGRFILNIKTHDMKKTVLLYTIIIVTGIHPYLRAQIVTELGFFTPLISTFEDI
jgi:hypothetical protein